MWFRVHETGFFLLGLPKQPALLFRAKIPWPVGILCCSYSREPQNSIGKRLGSYLRGL